MKVMSAGRRVSPDAEWEAKMLAEERAWVVMCQKLRANAARSHPDDVAGQNELFEKLRKQSLEHYWRAPQG